MFARTAPVQEIAGIFRARDREKILHRRPHAIDDGPQIPGVRLRSSPEALRALRRPPRSSSGRERRRAGCRTAPPRTRRCRPATARRCCRRRGSRRDLPGPGRRRSRRARASRNNRARSRTVPVRRRAPPAGRGSASPRNSSGSTRNRRLPSRSRSERLAQESMRP